MASPAAAIRALVLLAPDLLFHASGRRVWREALRHHVGRVWKHPLLDDLAPELAQRTCVCVLVRPQRHREAELPGGNSDNPTTCPQTRDVCKRDPTKAKCGFNHTGLAPKE